MKYLSFARGADSRVYPIYTKSNAKAKGLEHGWCSIKSPWIGLTNQDSIARLTDDPEQWLIVTNGEDGGRVILDAADSIVDVFSKFLFRAIAMGLRDQRENGGIAKWGALAFQTNQAPTYELFERGYL